MAMHVEMDVSRLRELTHSCFPPYICLIAYVEMVVTRLRELTQKICRLFGCNIGRVEMDVSRLRKLTQTRLSLVHKRKKRINYYKKSIIKCHESSCRANIHFGSL